MRMQRIRHIKNIHECLKKNQWTEDIAFEVRNMIKYTSVKNMATLTLLGACNRQFYT